MNVHTRVYTVGCIVSPQPNLAIVGRGQLVPWEGPASDRQRWFSLRDTDGQKGGVGTQWES